MKASVLRLYKMVKANRSGQAASLSPAQLDQIMAACGPKLRAALSVCRFTACRVTECLSLRWENIMQGTVVFPRMITKKKMATREVPISSKLQPILNEWKAAWPSPTSHLKGGTSRRRSPPETLAGSFLRSGLLLAAHAHSRQRLHLGSGSRQKRISGRGADCMEAHAARTSKCS